MGRDLWGGAQSKKKLMLGQDSEEAGAPSCLSLHLVLMRQGLPIDFHFLVPTREKHTHLCTR